MKMQVKIYYQVIIFFKKILDLLLGNVINSDSSIKENKPPVKDLFMLTSKKIENLPSSSNSISQKQNTNPPSTKTTKYAWDEEDIEDF
jgi:hypothetical protein